MKYDVPRFVWFSLWLIVTITILGGAATLINHMFILADDIAQRTNIMEKIFYHEVNIKAATGVAIALIVAYSLVVSNKYYLFICSVILCVTNAIPFVFNIGSMSSEPGTLSTIHLVLMFLITLSSGYSSYALRNSD